MEIVVHIVLGIGVWLILGWHVLSTWTGWLRALGVLAMLVVSISIYWTIWSEPMWLRTLMAIPMFLFIGKTWEVAARRISPSFQLQSPSALALWALCIPEGRWPSEPEERQQQRALGRVRLTRGVFKAAAFAGFLYLNQEVRLDEVFGLKMTWMCFTLYVLFSGLWDLIAGSLSSLGIAVSPMFDAPPLARNPRDFWGRRWNLWFTQSAHRLIFVPLGGRSRPLLAVSGVFIVSALLHEVIIGLGLQTVDGRMLVFFGLHGVATVAFTLFDHRWPKPWPRPLAISLHFVWFLSTASWFMSPADDATGMSSWTLEAAIGWLT